MPAPIVPIEFFQGDYHTRRFRIKNEFDPNALVDISGFLGFWCTVKRKTTDPDPGLFQLTLGSGIQLVDAFMGWIELDFSMIHTAAPELVGYTTRAGYDVQVKDPLARIWTVVSGPCLIKAGATRAA